jgi:CMP-N-acetylneuraminic acid synthetase
MARGKYIVRLDADDYFDESALLVLSGVLDASPEVALVYPNWTYVSEDGRELGTERRKKIGSEVNVLDLPPHGACTMVRTRVLKSIGGYDTRHSAQDGHELWLKVLHRFAVANVTTPLFYYRQHGASISQNEERLLSSRRAIKRSLALRNSGPVTPCNVAVIPAKNTYTHLPNIALKPLGGKPLIDYTLEAACAAGSFRCVYVYTDDPEVVDHCSNFQGVIGELRPSDLSSERARLSEILFSAVARLEEGHAIYPDIVALLSVHTPLRRVEHIKEALDTLELYNLDCVISTYEDYDLHFVHAQNGLKPLNPGMIDQIRLEREALYVGNGAIHVAWRDILSPSTLLSGKVGHIVMPRHHSHYIKSSEDFRVVSAIIERADPDTSAGLEQEPQYSQGGKDDI